MSFKAPLFHIQIVIESHHSDSQSVKKFLSGTLLSIYAANLLNPTILLHNIRGIALFITILTIHRNIDSLSIWFLESCKTDGPNRF